MHLRLVMYPPGGGLCFVSDGGDSSPCRINLGRISGDQKPEYNSRIQLQINRPKGGIQNDVELDDEEL